ncbi:MAG: NUDIX domain-containing protein [Clostridia bacterium]|nr:NUDIX domain-containing protein [Clostridia bacterium]
MKNSSLCYIEKDGAYLMLHRIKRKSDENGGKWIGIGGKFEEGESPEECCAREISEETGLVPNALVFRGIVTFVSDEYGTEYMHLFTCSDFSGEISECDEGVLEWVKIESVPYLELWEGDRIFLKLLADDLPPFLLKLVYKGASLVSATLDGQNLDL